MIKIVIVDDHQMVLDGLTSLLKTQKNFEIIFAENNAKKALIKLHLLIPDIIITDISMPEMNGLEFIKILRRDYPKVKILVLSGYENHSVIENIDGYLMKETSAKELILAINKIVLEDIKCFVNSSNERALFEFKKVILSIREKEIIRLISNENNTREIAEKLFISMKTVETHRKNIFIKLQVKNIAGLVKKAVYLGVIKP